MLMADTMAIFFVILGLLLAFPGLWVLCRVLWARAGRGGQGRRGLRQGVDQTFPSGFAAHRRDDLCGGGVRQFRPGGKDRGGGDDLSLSDDRELRRGPVCRRWWGERCAG